MDIINNGIDAIKKEIKKNFDIDVVDISKRNNEFFLQVKKSKMIGELVLSLKNIGEFHHVPTRSFDFIVIKGI